MRPTAAIRDAEIEGLRVVLDLRSEQYHVLDDVATAMWEALTTAGSRSEAVDRLEQRFDVDRERLRSDLDRFTAGCEARGFLEPADRAARPDRPERTGGRAARRRGSAWLAYRAVLSLIGTTWRLRRSGFRRTYEDCTRLPAATAPPDPALASSAARAFLHAEEVFLARRAPDDCLTRSLALYRFLRGVGLPAEHVIGVRRVPFRAHAWVELAGEPVIDDSGRRLRFVPLARIAAPWQSAEMPGSVHAPSNGGGDHEH